MSIPGTIRQTAAVALCAGLLAGCGASDAVTDYMGFGKYSPDETQVSTNQSLTMPPDLQLRPPGEGQAAPPPQQAFSPSQPVTTAPPQYGTVDPNQTYDATRSNTQVATATAPQTTVPQAPATAPAAAEDPYAKWGISKTRPDGTKKSEAELRDELRKVAIKQKQAQNPNYGSVFNLPNVWSD